MKTTQQIKVPEKLIDQVIGQEEAVRIIKKAALQRRHVLLIGDPGTGKSMLGLALAQLLPNSELKDIISIANLNDENNPLIQEVPAGAGREEVKRSQLDSKQVLKSNNFLLFIVAIITLIAPWWVRNYYKSDVMFAAFFLGGMLFLATFAMMLSMGQRMFKGGQQLVLPAKVIVDNYGKKQAPFFDATGAHAGALLGDVLHDPFQSFPVVTRLGIFEKGNFVERKIDFELNKSFNKHKNRVYRKEKNNYEAVFLPKGELTVLGENNNSISPVEVLSSNRYDYEGEMIKLTTSENKELIVTPEHAIAIWKNGKISYVHAKDVKEGEEVVSKKEDIIIDDKDIINTYDERQLKLTKSYYDYLELKNFNPSWGYKRLATKLGVSCGRTRWWSEKKSAPVPVQTIEWLKTRKLLPLKIDNSKLPLISKVLGATFGDGGIFENLNGIFLSSSNYKDVEEFGNDLQNIFGKAIAMNHEIREGGEYGHSWCLTNTNRAVIRFFIALGTPKGNKTKKELKIPSWINLKEETKDEFYGSIFGSELGVSGYNNLLRIEFGITGLEMLEANRMNFLNEIIHYLRTKNVMITNRGIDYKMLNTDKSHRGNRLYRFILSQSLLNIERFCNNIKINYCNLKKWKLITALNEEMKDKLLQYLSLRAKGLGAESIMERLEINPEFLYKILNNTKIDFNEVTAL